MKKRYKLEYFGDFPMVIDVDHEVFTEAVFKECSEFWGSKPDFKDWLAMVYMIALRESVASWSATASLREGREEGFPKMDGSEGIEIISMEEFCFDEFEVTCSEIPI